MRTNKGGAPHAPEDIQRAWEGFVAQPFPRALINGAQAPTSGDVRFTLVPFRGGDVVTNLICYVHSSAGANVSLFRLGLYETTGTLLAQTGDVKASLATFTWLVAPLSSPYTIQGHGSLYVAAIATLSSGVDTPTIGTYASNTQGLVAISGGRRPSGVQTGQTDLPSTATISDNADNRVHFLAAS